jgi:HSP20 family protein
MAESSQNWLTNIQDVQREMERLLDYLGSSKPPRVHLARIWEPAVDVYATDREVVALVELAGVKRDMLELVVGASTVQLRGERRDLGMGGDRTYYRMEIHKGPFEKVIHLPFTIDSEHTRASYEDGLLVIVMPRVSVGSTHRLIIRVRE